MVAALTATMIAPAKAGPASEPLVSVANATLPSVALPNLLDPNGKPVLSAPEANSDDAVAPPSSETVQAVKRTSIIGGDQDLATEILTALYGAVTGRRP